nr:MAG TPA: hypothetical protein [Caudoviricetes sp.]
MQSQLILDLMRLIQKVYLQYITSLLLHAVHYQYCLLQKPTHSYSLLIQSMSFLFYSQ